MALVKIRIEKDALADAVNWTARALGNSRTGKNIGLGIEAEGDSVVLIAYDRDISARHHQNFTFRACNYFLNRQQH